MYLCYSIFWCKTLKKNCRKVSTPTNNPACVAFIPKSAYRSYIFDVTRWIQLSMVLNMNLFLSDLVDSSYDILGLSWGSSSRNTRCSWYILNKCLAILILLCTYAVSFILLYLLSMLAKVTLLLVECHWNGLKFFNVIENFKAILKALKVISDPYLDVLKLFFLFVKLDVQKGLKK